MAVHITLAHDGQESPAYERGTRPSLRLDIPSFPPAPPYQFLPLPASAKSVHATMPLPAIAEPVTAIKTRHEGVEFRIPRGRAPYAERISADRACGFRQYDTSPCHVNMREVSPGSSMIGDDSEEMVELDIRTSAMFRTTELKRRSWGILKGKRNGYQRLVREASPGPVEVSDGPAMPTPGPMEVSEGPEEPSSDPLEGGERRRTKSWMPFRRNELGDPAEAIGRVGGASGPVVEDDESGKRKYSRIMSNGFASIGRNAKAVKTVVSSF